MNNALTKLAELYWDVQLEANPSIANLQGDHRFDDRIENVSEEEEQRVLDSYRGLLAEAESIDPSGLTDAGQITRRVLLFELETMIESTLSRQIEFNIDPMVGIHMMLVNYAPQFSAAEPVHADALVAKAAAAGPLLDQAMDRHRAGVAGGRTPPRISVEKALAQMEAYLASPIDQDPFMRMQPAASMGEADVAAWRDRIAEKVHEVVRPAMQRYRNAIAEEVLPHARPPEKSGLCWLPGGEEMYAREMHKYTTIRSTAEEVHQIGLDEVAALEGEYRAMGQAVFGTSDLDQIFDRLNDDESLRFDSSEEIISASQDAMERANAAAPEWFGRLPKTPCLVQAMPDIGAEDQPLAYYLQPAQDGSRPGIFFINTTEPTTRNRYESEALAFHEGVPGHHLQIAIAQELDGVPTFQRHALVTAYVEGWGLYSERLADEMGLYRGDIERLGILAYDSWRAGRLVVDTGIHALGWSRQQAIDYLAANSPLAANNIVNEVERYIGYAGQALAYKIFRLREGAEQTLGNQFDIKGFHDAVLGSGMVPLEALGDIVHSWSGA